MYADAKTAREGAKCPINVCLKAHLHVGIKFVCPRFFLTYACSGGPAYKWFEEAEI